MSARGGFFLAIDVRVDPRRAADNHIARLVYGIFDRHHPAGLSRMLDIAEEMNYRAACYLDYCAYDVFGSAWLDVAKYILARGHSLQLAANPQLIQPNTWEKLGLNIRPASLAELDDGQAASFLDYLLDLHAGVSDVFPVAFRGASQHCNPELLDCLKMRGIRVITSLTPGAAINYDSVFARKPFFYPNGLLELPLTAIDHAATDYSLADLAQGEEYIPAGDEIFNPWFHCASLLELDPATGTYAYDPNGPAYYRQILANAAKQGLTPVSIEEISLCALWGKQPCSLRPASRDKNRSLSPEAAKNYNIVNVQAN